jgi:hypothetical protein
MPCEKKIEVGDRIPSSAIRAAIVAVAVVLSPLRIAQAAGAEAEFTFWLGFPGQDALKIVDQGRAALSEGPLEKGAPDKSFWAYANDAGRVRAQVFLGGPQPLEGTTKLIWRKTFRKLTSSDVAHYTVDVSGLELKVTEPEVEYDETPLAQLSMTVTLYDATVVTRHDELSGLDVPQPPTPQPQFLHTATISQDGFNSVTELANERTELFGSEVWDRDEVQESGNSPVAKRSFTTGLNQGKYQMGPYRGQVRLDEIGEGGLYTVEYVIFVTAVHDGGEFFAKAYLGDPLDVDSGFQLETTSEAVDEEPATMCSAQSNPSRFSFDVANATVTDTYTGLMWQRCPLGYSANANGTASDLTDDRCEVADATASNWQTALQRSAGDALAGHTDWRLPNIKELDSIVEPGCHLPTIDPAVFPDTPLDFFWSSTADTAGDAARTMDFGQGFSAPRLKTSTAHARLVRTTDRPTIAPLPALRVGRAAAVAEGAGTPTTLIFPIELDRASDSTVTVNYETRDYTATSGSDYVGASGTLTIPAGVRRAEVAVQVMDDAVGEGYEALYLVLASASSNARLAVNANLGQIEDDEPLVSIAPSFAVAEGDAGTTSLSFTVALSEAATTEIAVDYASSNGTAIAASDYSAATGTLRIPAGSTSGSIPINVLGDLQAEGDETFSVTLTAVSTNARLSPGSAIAEGTILEDDIATTLQALNDTGIVQCADAFDQGLACTLTASFPGQDAQFGRDVTNNDNSDGVAGFSFTKLDAAGAALANQAAQYAVTPWDCVRDEVTGLEWEVKTDDGGLRDKDWTYTWYNSTGINHGGSAGTENGGTCVNTASCDTEKYVAAVNAAGLCGHNDWRMPGREELQSIVDFSDTTHPLYDSGYFPNSGVIDGTGVSQSSNYWTATPSAASPQAAWAVKYLDGNATPMVKTLQQRTRLVRSGN